ncbi:MAG: helix-turn-helix transcriptional regulator [Lachnospiraceae bacterium]|nr:helix-turn-helix transcriptional regulator [Lachnospiraceae bacterium]
MSKELFSLADRIKSLREGTGMTQAEIARRLGISRSGVNAWEMGLSVPSTQYIVELARNYGVSTDYLLGMKETSTISVKGLSQKQVSALLNIIECFKNNDEQKN